MLPYFPQRTENEITGTTSGLIPAFARFNHPIAGKSSPPVPDGEEYEPSIFPVTLSTDVIVSVEGWLKLFTHLPTKFWQSGAAMAD